MLKFLFPDLYCPSIYDINYEMLLALKKKALLFDLDNTLEPFDVSRPSRKVVEHLQYLKSKGFLICLISNNQESRVKKFNEELGLPFVYKAKKPGKAGVGKALKLLGAKKEQAVLVGDQIFTDVWCGNRCGLFTVLVEPVAERDEFSVALKRGLEKKVIKYYLRRRELDTR